MLKLDLMLQIMNQIDHCRKGKSEYNWINERIMSMMSMSNIPIFVGVRTKISSYLMNDGREEKKLKRHKKLCHKKKT